jgi:hypothetical protein
LWSRADYKGHELLRAVTSRKTDSQRTCRFRGHLRYAYRGHTGHDSWLGSRRAGACLSYSSCRARRHSSRGKGYTPIGISTRRTLFTVSTLLRKSRTPNHLSVSLASSNRRVCLNTEGRHGSHGMRVLILRPCGLRLSRSGQLRHRNGTVQCFVAIASFLPFETAVIGRVGGRNPYGDTGRTAASARANRRRFWDMVSGPATPENIRSTVAQLTQLVGPDDWANEQSERPLGPRESGHLRPN